MRNSFYTPKTHKASIKAGKYPKKVPAQGLFCFWAVGEELGVRATVLAMRLRSSRPAVSLSLYYKLTRSFFTKGFRLPWRKSLQIKELPVVFSWTFCGELLWPLYLFVWIRLFVSFVFQRFSEIRVICGCCLVAALLRCEKGSELQGKCFYGVLWIFLSFRAPDTSRWTKCQRISSVWQHMAIHILMPPQDRVSMLYWLDTSQRKCLHQQQKRRQAALNSR